MQPKLAYVRRVSLVCIDVDAGAVDSVQIRVHMDENAEEGRWNNAKDCSLGRV